MSTDDLGRKQTPAKHNTNAFAMLKKTAVEEAPPTPKPEKDAPPAKKNESSRATTPKTVPKTTTNTQPKARQERAKTPPQDQQPTEEIEQPRTQENPDEAKERPTELVTLYLPLDLREAFKRQAKAEKATHPMLAFTAVEAAYPLLEDLLSQHVSGPSKAPQVSLFQRSGRQSRGRTTHTKDYGDLQFRITRTNAEILDGLVEQFNAPTRNILLTTSIRHYLDYPIADDE
ncbi:hypothetical protein [Brevibacterium aurantiacum]|uniref:Uncharacterized protein n=1 Tax=Brevibacterium aurantiacum TaxID=273384 RepID=A0A2H1KBC8_BREAU|nr:hypothetical protein [Brevibacterium aurantiacum]SMX97053.1 hypothetical protein BAURA63_03160 [Brevibacterium aurantiacum]